MSNETEAGRQEARLEPLVGRLRRLADCDARSGEPLGKCMREAAAEIERLRAALQEMVSAQSAGLMTDSMFNAWIAAKKLLTPNETA